MRVAGFAQMRGGVWRGDFGEGFLKTVEDSVGAGGDEDAFGLEGIC